MTITINPKNEKELAKIKAILKEQEIDFVEDLNDDWWNKISDAEQKSIEAGLAESEKGLVISHEDFLKSYEKD